jgi:ferredoxin
MPYLVRIDEGACAAHGDCVDIAPDVFVLDDVARVIGTAPDEVLLAAAEACPSAAILLVDQRTDDQAYL